MPAGLIQAGDKSSVDWVFSCQEDNRNTRGGFLCRQPPWAIRSDYSHSATNEIGRQGRQPIVLIVREAVLDRHVLALDIARFLQAPPPRGPA
jgi:hypothetical protein